MPHSSEESSQDRTILLVEDNPGDARLVTEVCRDLGITDMLHTVSTGSDALDFVKRRGEHADVPRTDIVILDWHLPSMSGRDVLEELNSDPALGHIPVIVSSGPLPEREVREVYEKNANACITKPTDPDELEELIRAIEAFWVSAATLPPTDRGEE